MSGQKVYLDDIYASEKCGGSAFKAVVLMSHEARFLNEQERLGFIEMEKKPTTIAMDKFKQDRLEMESISDIEAAAEAEAAAKKLAAEEVFEAKDAMEEVVEDSDLENLSNVSGEEAL